MTKTVLNTVFKYRFHGFPILVRLREKEKERSFLVFFWGFSLGFKRRHVFFFFGGFPIQLSRDIVLGNNQLLLTFIIITVEPGITFKITQNPLLTLSL